MCEFISLFLNIIITITILVDDVATNNWGLFFDDTVVKTQKLFKGFLNFLPSNEIFLSRNVFFYALKVTPVSQKVG